MTEIDDFVNHIYYCNCLALLKALPSNSVQCLITDPPYFISTTNNKISRKNTTDILLDFGSWDKYESIEDYFKFTDQWFSECCRVIEPKGWLYIFFDRLKIGIFDLQLAPKNNIKSRTIFSWIKSNPPPSYRKVNWISATEQVYIGSKDTIEEKLEIFNNSTEEVWVGSKGECKLKNFLKQTEMRNWYMTPCRSNYRQTDHPTEKPEEIIELFIRASTNPNDIVLDCFCGSGTTLAVAKRLHRRFIGCDYTLKYAYMSRNRVLNTHPPKKLIETKKKIQQTLF